MITRFNVCDLNAIETRVGAWLAGCDALLNVFIPCEAPDGSWCPNGRDPYLDFGCKMHGFVYNDLWMRYHSKDDAIKAAAKLIRQMAKPGVLGAIYRLGGGDWVVNENGDRVRTGLWGYAWNMGIELTQEQAHMIVRMFREAYPEICSTEVVGNVPVGIWKRLEVATQDVIRGERTVRHVGPGGCVRIDKLIVDGRPGDLMRMQLPSGRRLHYLDARLAMTQMPWEDRETGEPAWKEALCYNGQNQKTGQWSKITTHGGKLFENLVQGIARDVLAVKLLEFEENDMPVVGHVHDEGICLVLDDPFSPRVDDMVRIMSTPIDWAPGLLLGADGFEDAYYHK